MSEGPRGYLQFSQPVKNPGDGYYYQSCRYVDFYGKCSLYGDQPLKSRLRMISPNSFAESWWHQWPSFKIIT